MMARSIAMIQPGFYEGEDVDEIERDVRRLRADVSQDGDHQR